MSLSPLRKSLLALASGAAFVALAEVGLRAAGFEHKAIREPIVVWDSIQDKELDSDTSLHRVSAELLWEPRPGAPIPWGKDSGEVVSADTRRGPLRGPHAPDGVLRIVALGDSSTFGGGEAYSNTYCAQLERKLGERGIPAEVIDLGVIGYTVRQGLERWRELGREQHPDIVIAAFGAVNDHLAAIDVADDLRIQQSRERNDALRVSANWVRDHSRLVHAAARIVEGRQVVAAERREQWFKRWEAQRAKEARLGYADYTGVRRVGLPLFEQTLGELESEVAASGARLMLICMPRRNDLETENPVLVEYTQLVRRYASEHQLDCIDAHALFRDRKRFEAEGVQLYHDNVHPTTAGHQLIAEELCARIAARAAAGSAR
jgi:lysophospholipase L1-like esterase